MEFLERNWDLCEQDDYSVHVRARMVEYKAAEATPIHITLSGEQVLVGWVLRHKVLL